MIQKFKTPFLKLVNYFTHDSDIQNSHDIYRQRLLISFSFVVAIVVGLLFILLISIEGLENNKSLYTFPISVILCTAIPWVLKKNGKQFFLSAFIITISALFMAIRIATTGGIYSPTMIWFSTLPLFSALLISVRASYITTFFIIILLFIIAYPSFFGISITNTIANPSLYFYMPAVALFLLSSSTYLYESERNKYARLIKISEQELALNKKMASLGSLAAGIAHEINNPLTIIQGQAERLKSLALNCKNTDQALSHSENIIKTTLRISSIIGTLKAYTRLDDLASSFEKVSINSLLKAIIENQKKTIALENIKLIEPTIDNSVSIYLQPKLIEQAFNHIISNAIYACKDLPNRWIKIECYIDNNLFITTITDAGKGIPLKTVDHMMDPFFTTKPIGVGTGLGLSFSLGIIEKHNGALFYNKESQNTQFVIQLPIQQKNTNIY